MKIRFSALKLPSAGALVLPVAETGKLTGMAAALDQQSDGALSRAQKASRFTGKTEQMLEILAPAGVGLSRVLLAGIGKAGTLDALGWQRLGGRVMARLLCSGESRVAIAIEDLKGEVTTAQAAALTAAGARLRSYRFDKYRTKEPADKKPSVKELSLLCAEARAASSAYGREDKVIDGVFLTRDLVSEPANVIFPKSFADKLGELVDLDVKIEVLGEKKMRALGMGALLGVAQGSAHEPQLVAMRYDGGKKGEAPVVFIGKGVTFDSGGISIKPAAGMEQMKWDMGGAGTVAGAIKALAGRKAKANVIGIVGLVENMPSGTAQRPGDVVTSMSGQTVEVINTDAEGRLVLADAMTYAQRKFKPRLIVDLATLTGAMMVALGHEYAGLFANDDKLAEQLLAASQATGDKIWRMPLGPAYDRMINTPTADMKNVGGRNAGAITAAQFLQRFIENDLPWAHLDIAGTVWVEQDNALWEKGATGHGVRLLDRFIADNFEG